jgi:hypothetical protein
MHDEQLRVLGGTVSWRAMTTTTFPGKKGCEEKRFAVHSPCWRMGGTNGPFQTK